MIGCIEVTNAHDPVAGFSAVEVASVEACAAHLSSVLTAGAEKSPDPSPLGAFQQTKPSIWR